MTDLQLLEPPISQQDTPPSGTARVKPVLLASVGRRSGAFLVDSVIVSVAASLLNRLITASTSSWWDFFVTVAVLMVSQVYYFVPYATTGQTPGKYAFGIKVISTDGTPLNWRKALLRISAAAILSTPLMGLGYWWAYWNKKRQTWHDKIAKTCVILASQELSADSAIEPVQPQTPILELLRIMLMVVYVIGLMAGIALTSPLFSNVPTTVIDLTEMDIFGGLNLYDEDYDSLTAALTERVKADESTSAVNVSFEYSYTPGEEEAAVIWLLIDMSPTGCAAAVCESLTDDLATITLNTYGRLDELTGITFAVIESGAAGPVEWSNTVFDKSLTIEEWRAALDR
jgi:uncharacterized RDD family membrane protein YckC